MKYRTLSIIAFMTLLSSQAKLDLTPPFKFNQIVEVETNMNHAEDHELIQLVEGPHPQRPNFLKEIERELAFRKLP